MARRFAGAIAGMVASLTLVGCRGAPATAVTPDAPDTAVVTSTVAGASPTSVSATVAAVAPTASVSAVTATPLPPTAVPPAAVPTATARPAPTATDVPRPTATTAPVTDQAAVARGKAIFLSSVGCALCHTINGLSTGDQGPNLTHIAGLPYDGLPNDPAFLRRWITNPQAIRPGTLMPDLGLTAAQVNDLVAFLETMH